MSTRIEANRLTWGKDASPWREVPAEDWNSVEWQLRNLVRTPEQLRTLLGISSHEVDALMRLRKQFRFAISPYYFSLIDREDPSDPIRRMIIPSLSRRQEREAWTRFRSKRTRWRPV